jgi:hypothetical protein
LQSRSQAQRLRHERLARQEHRRRRRQRHHQLRGSLRHHRASPIAPIFIADWSLQRPV